MKEDYRDFVKFIKTLKIKNPRIKIIKLISLFTAATLLIRITYIHHVHSYDYMQFIQKQENKTIIKKSQTRGSIYDRFGLELASNTPVTSVIYRFDEKTHTDMQLYKTAFTLAEMLDVDIKKLGNHDFKAVYQNINPGIDWSDITNRDLKTLTHLDKKAQAIYKKMSEARYGGENTIKFDASDIEIAKVTEYGAILPGVEVVTQSKRKYPEDLGYFDIVGRVSEGGSDLPIDDLNIFITNGYSINDQIGRTSIESLYEDLLRGHKSISQINTDGFIKDIDPGFKGANLTITMDTEFSDNIDMILEKRMADAKKNRSGARYMREAYVVVTDPFTGEVLSLNGKILNEDGIFVDHTLGTMINSFTVGSVVKGATLMTGYSHGVTNYGDTVYDRPMIFSDGSEKASWKQLGMVNDIQAIRSSSNVYFMHQAITMGGANFVARAPIHLEYDPIDDYRRMFNEFGLGVHTGIDLPGETRGMRNMDRSLGKLLDFVIGQSDTYTTLQLAQYVSTIANGGNRFALQLVKEASIKIDDDLILLHSVEPQVLNQIDLPEEAFERVREGFRQVCQDPQGTGTGFFANSKHSPAGKTGTAEEFVRDAEGELIYTQDGNLISTHHMTFVGYAPHSNPEIAIAIIFPQAELPQENNPIALEVANDIFDEYFRLQKERINVDF